MIKKFSCFVFGSLLSAHLSAQETADTLPDVRSGVLEAVEHKAASDHQTLNGHTLDLTYLGRNSLLRQQGNTFINTLERIPGVSAINTGVGISKPVLRGLSLNRVVVTENGLKQEGQQWGVDHGLEIDQYSVDQVEVLKGPVSVIYGTDGIGGVINILPPIVPAKNTFKGEAISTYKSNNDLLGGSVKLSLNRNDIYTIVRGTYQNFASYRVPADRFFYNGYILPIYDHRLKNTGGREANFQITQGIRRQWGQMSLTVSNVFQQMGFFVGAFGKPRAYDLYHPESFRTVNKPYQLINHFKVIHNGHFHIYSGQLEWDLGYQNNTRQEIAQPHQHNTYQVVRGNQKKDASLFLNLQTLQLNARFTRQWEKVRNVAGLASSLQHNRSAGDEFLIPSYFQYQAGLFDYLEYQASDKLLWTAGGRVDLIRQTAECTIADSYDRNGSLRSTDTLSPVLSRNYFNAAVSAGLKYQYSTRQAVRFNAGTAFRVPAINELLSNGIHHGTFRHEKGSELLKEERGVMLDAGWTLSRPKWSVDITPFANYFTNYIFLKPSGIFSPLEEAGQIYLYDQGAAFFGGLEMAVQYKITPALVWSSDMEYVYNRHLETGRGLPMTPPMSWRNDITYKPLWNNDLLDQFYISLEGHYFAPQHRTYINEPVTEGYFLLNASLSNSFRLRGTRLTAYLQVRNLTNAVYMNNMSRYRILNLPEQGRNIQVMLRYEF